MNCNEDVDDGDDDDGDTIFIVSNINYERHTRKKQ